MGDKILNTALTAYSTLTASTAAKSADDAAMVDADPSGIVCASRNTVLNLKNQIDKLIGSIDVAISNDTFDAGGNADLTAFRDALTTWKKAAPELAAT